MVDGGRIAGEEGGALETPTVARNRDAILERMPCDGAWPNEQIAVFQDWVESATPA